MSNTNEKNDDENSLQIKDPLIDSGNVNCNIHEADVESTVNIQTDVECFCEEESPDANIINNCSTEPNNSSCLVNDDLVRVFNSCENETETNDANLNDSKTMEDDDEQINITENSDSNYFGLIPMQNNSSHPNNSPGNSDFISSITDNSIVISNCNAVPQSDSIVESNFSLSQLRCYGSDESLNEESLEEKTCYRDTKKDVYLSDKESDSESSSTSSSSSIVIADSSDSESDLACEKTTLPKPIKAKGELDLNDLPPIEDLKISVPEEDCTPIGHVFQIVDKLVVIQALKDKPALNLDSVLFIQEGKPFGKVFDVFGPVSEPYYCVRFNSNDQIKEKNICINQVVYCAPKTKYTNYVFLTQLLQFKGSDASWVDDLEPPTIYLEYSDDEQERVAKKKAKRKNAKTKQHSEPDESEKHFSYERRMNKRNLQISASKNKTENHERENFPWKHSSSLNVASSSYSSPDVPHQMFGRPPVFIDRLPTPMGSFPPRMNQFPTRPAMFQSKPDFIPPRPGMFQSKPDFIPSRPDMFPPRFTMLGPPGTNTPPFSCHSFQTPPQRIIDRNYYSQAQRPCTSSRPENAYSPFPPRPSNYIHDETYPRLRNPFPNEQRLSHTNLPTGNLWLQRPQSPSHVHPNINSVHSGFQSAPQQNNSPHTSFRSSPQQNNSPHMSFW